MFNFFRKLLRLAGALSLLTVAIVALALPASASTNHHGRHHHHHCVVRPPVVPPATFTILTPTITLDDENGVLTTPQFVYVGEVLQAIIPPPAFSHFAHGVGEYTITSVSPDGPLNRVTLDSPLVVVPPQTSVLVSFHIVSIPPQI